jgi:hypothetical protein
MHYTSLENIHKVIDPLFLDDLKQEFEDIKQVQIWNGVNGKKNKLENFQQKLSELTFLEQRCLGLIQFKGRYV